MAKYEYAIGTTASNMEYLFKLDIIPPLSNFKPYNQAVELGDGSIKGMGWQVAEWYWSFVSEEQRDLLKAYCPGLSAEVFIRTLDDALDWRDYRALMIWPVEAEDRQVGASMKFQITFRIREDISYP